MRYEVKCNECKQAIRHTDDVRESYAGGRCNTCEAEIRRQLNLVGELLRKADRKNAALLRSTRKLLRETK